MAERWNDGVVFPLGRSIVRAERDPSAAISEASAALEVIHKWREAAPTGDASRLQLISLERGLYYTLERLEERAWTSGRADLVRDVATTYQEAAVIGPLLASSPPALTDQPASGAGAGPAAGSGSPATQPPVGAQQPRKPTNDTDLEKP